MKKTLHDIVFTSNLAQDTLLLLNDGPKDIESILSTLKTNRQALFPQIRLLKEKNIIYHEGDSCGLTAFGKIIVNKMVPLLSTFDLLEDLSDYKLDFIPPHLLKRVGEIGPCNVIDPSLPEICELDKEFHRKSEESRSVISITTFLFPNFSDIFAAYTEKGVHVSIVISDILHDKLKCSNYNEYKKLLDNEITEIYVHEAPLGLVSFTQNDYSILLRLLSGTEYSNYDYKRILFQRPASLAWGRDLFDHYKKKSLQVTDI
ncbi:transcriptional regulator FilR1 domain-containing protein [Methanolobus sp. ZRKC2]|uniref:helix-turn-helix transcriptional regulator n=1 Tax=Methanolobus sp. ZRKC2 TaxID=3125783 RepID=UPI00324C3D0D